MLAHLVKAQRAVIVGADEFGGVQAARLQRLENLATRKVGDRCAHLLPDLPAKAGGAEAQALNVVQPGQFLVEPATGLRAGVARQEALHAELVIDLVPHS